MYKAKRQWTYNLFAPDQGGRLGLVVDWLIMGLILVNVVAVMVGTVTGLATRYASVLQWIELVSIGVFTVEYVGRIWSGIEHPAYQGRLTGHVRFASRPLLVVDLLAILPFYLTAIGLGVDLRFLRAYDFSASSGC